MAVILPIICWVVIYVRLLLRSFPWRDAFIAASLAWGGLVVLITEILSLAHVLNPLAIASAWIIVAGGSLFFFPVEKVTQQWRATISLSNFEQVVLGAMAVIIAVSFTVAVIAPPNNWDSMTYHMSRVVHWLQNGSVAHYPTHILRQIYLNPWAEFAITQFQALNDGDRLANLVQWFSMVGSVIGVTLIAEHLGVDRTGQMMAAVVAVTIPMGILQSTSTQNDLVVAFWLICFVWYGLKLMKDPSAVTGALAVGVSLGLAILSKGTAYLYALPFIIWFAIFFVKRVPSRVPTYCAIVTGCVIAINAGHFSRNMILFSNPLGSPSKMVNARISARGTLSNIIRNLSTHLALPYEPFNKAVESTAGHMHSLIGTDINDDATTFIRTEFKVLPLKYHEDSDGNLLHTILTICATSIILVLALKRKVQPVIVYYSMAVLSGFVIYCMLLRWQPWCSRLHLPLFVLFSPISGYWISQLAPRIRSVIVSILLIAALPWLIQNVSRPLLPYAQSIFVRDRLSQIFSSRPELYGRYNAAAESIHSSGARQIGLVLGIDTWEYPLWVLLRTKGGPMPRIEHIDVKNRSGSITLDQFNPSLLVVIRHQGYPKVLPLSQGHSQAM